MGLETGTLIIDFDSDWPLGTDDVSQGDDHIRLIKSILQNALPGNTAVFTFTGTDLHIVNADIFTRDIDIETANIHQEIQACPQVCIALGRLDGTTATLEGNYFGITGIQRSTGGNPGSYDITMVESPGSDIGGAGSAFFGLIGGYIVAVYPGPTNNVARVQVRDATQNNAPLVDVPNVTFFVFDSGRD